MLKATPQASKATQKGFFSEGQRSAHSLREALNKLLKTEGDKDEREYPQGLHSEVRRPQDSYSACSRKAENSWQPQALRCPNQFPSTGSLCEEGHLHARSVRYRAN